MKRAVLVGASSPLDSSFLREEKGFFVACDRGYLAFREQEREPDLLVADFDTLDPSLVRSPKDVIRLSPVKDDTDVFYALKVLLERGYDEFHLYGCLGGERIEHEIANVVLLSYLLDRGKRGVLYTNDNRQELFLLGKGTYEFVEESGFLSLFSQQRGTRLSLRGLKYELDDKELDPTVPLGVSNEFLPGRKAVVTLHEGRVLVVKERRTNEKEQDIDR